MVRQKVTAHVILTHAGCMVKTTTELRLFSYKYRTKGCFHTSDPELNLHKDSRSYSRGWLQLTFLLAKIFNKILNSQLLASKENWTNNKAFDIELMLYQNKCKCSKM